MSALTFDSTRGGGGGAQLKKYYQTSFLSIFYIVKTSLPAQ